MVQAPRRGMLSREQIERIEREAEGTLDDVFGTPDPPIPVNVNRVATALDLTIKQGTFTNPEIIGFYDRAERTIYVSESDLYTRQSFTIAHEIGHRVLHQDVPKETFFRHAEMELATDDRVGEQEANWFAASLLMPRTLVIGYWRAFPGDIETLASIFKVSLSAMRYRVKNLRLTDG